LTEIAGLGGSLGTSPCPLDTRVRAECTCPIKAGKSAVGTELLLTYAETIDAVSSMNVPPAMLSLIAVFLPRFDLQVVR
jgi:hypothetical protein